MHPSQTYPSDLTDDEWPIIQPLIPKPKGGGRPIKHHYGITPHSLKAIGVAQVNALGEGDPVAAAS